MFKVRCKIKQSQRTRETVWRRRAHSITDSVLAHGMAELLASAFSSVFHSTVVTYDEYCRDKEKNGWESDTKLDIGQLFRLSYVSGPFGDFRIPEGAKILIHVNTLVGTRLTMRIPPSTEVRLVKEAIELKEGLPIDRQRLIFSGKQLEDDRTLEDYGITQGHTLHVILKLTGGGAPPVFTLDTTLLDPAFDYDFTGLKDEGTKFTLGGHTYHRPYGWRRYAFKVLGKYGGDTWLGKKGYRVDSSPGEWPVSYHGTAIGNTGNIAQEGYDLSKGKRFLYGRGVYSTPSIEVAAKYASRFQHKGKNYRVVFQNRVSPSNLKIVSADDTGMGVVSQARPNQPQRGSLSVSHTDRA